MSLRKSVILFSLVYSSYVSAQLPPPEAWKAANENLLRLDPGEFEGLPADVTNDLLSRGCAIPQSYMAKGEKEGVVRASFFSAGSSDLAVLCSVDKVSTILVYRDSSTTEIHELAQAPDEGYFQTIGDGEIGYSRAIGATPPATIRAYYEFFGGPELPPLIHDGLEHSFVGKGSTILYWYQDQWLGLQGND